MRACVMMGCLLLVSMAWAGLLAPGGGLRGSFYATEDLTGPAMTRYAAVNVSWKADAPVLPEMKPGAFSAQWRGYLLPAFSESYTFTVTATGGIRLIINDRRVINNWTPHPAKADTGVITLQAEKLTAITLQTTQPAGAGMVTLQWSSKSQPLASVPATRLYPPLFSPALLIYAESADPRASALYASELDGVAKKITVDGSAQPVLSPDGKQVLFSTVANQYYSSSGIFRVGATGQNMGPLTRPGDAKFDPSYSCDGQTIIYICKTPTAWEIWTMWSNGTHRTRILESAVEVRRPLLLPDGTGIVYQGKKGGQWNIYRAKIDGADETVLTTAGGADPALNRRGDVIAFVSTRAGLPQLYTMKADGSDQAALVVTTGAVSAPFFDRTGARIGYLERDAKGKSHLFLMDMTDRIPCQVTGSGKCFAAAMTPILTMPAAENLVLWLNAQQEQYLDVDAQNRVVAWNDLSTREHHATQPNSNERPALRLNSINTYPTVYFDGSQRLLVPDVSAGWAGTEGTLVVLFRPADCAQYTLIHQENGGVSEYWRYNGNGDGYFGFFCQGRYENYPPAMPSAGIHLLTLIVGAQYAAYLDGVALPPREARFLLPTSLTIGTGGDAGYFRGDIAELALFNRALSDEERQLVEAKFRALYNLMN